MGTGPACQANYDLALTERIDGESVSYLVEVGSEAGAEVLAGLPQRAARPEECAAAADEIASAATKMRRQMPETDLRQLLVDSRES
jgi:hypothetical protein